MYAQEGKVYAIVNHGKVTQIFTKSDIQSWNEADIFVVQIPEDKVSLVQIGTQYIDEQFVIMQPIQTGEGKYALLNVNNQVEMVFDKHTKPQYYENEVVIPLNEYQNIEVDIGCVYDKDSQAFIIDIHKARKIYIDKVDRQYEAALLTIIEDTPVTEILTWEAQEREARAYLETKDRGVAKSIAIMADMQQRDLEEFATKIMQKAELYRIASAALIGYRQKLIKDIEAADTLESIRAVQFDTQYVQTLLSRAQ